VNEFCRTLLCPGSPLAAFGIGSAGVAEAHASSWTDLLSAREWATLIWAVLALIAVMFVLDIRRAPLNVARVVCSGTLVRPATVMLAYVAAIVLLGSHIGLWEPHLLGATLAWVVLSALMGFFRVLRATEDAHYLRTALRRAFAVAVVVDAYVNLFVLPFAGEMVLIPFATLLGMLIAVGQTAPELRGDEYDTTRRLLQGMANALGWGLLVYTTVHVASELASGSGLTELGRGLLLPLWLNLALIPFTYLLALRLVYETAFVRLTFPANATSKSVRRAKLALLLGSGLRPYVLRGFDLHEAYKLNSANSLSEALRIVTRIRDERSAKLLASQKPPDEPGNQWRGPYVTDAGETVLA
jgi:hypothetical protein